MKFKRKSLILYAFKSLLVEDAVVVAGVVAAGVVVAGVVVAAPESISYH